MLPAPQIAMTATITAFFNGCHLNLQQLYEIVRSALMRCQFPLVLNFFTGICAFVPHLAQLNDRPCGACF